MKKVLIYFFSLLLFISQTLYANPSLWLTEAMINLRFNVDNISSHQLQKKLPDIALKNTLLFDVRRPEEYQQSRIEGSIQIDPQMKAKDFISRYGNKIHHKDLIFYCSVGYRSSKFIQRIKKLAKASDAKNIYNLSGGIFRWYNEHLKVINNAGETNAIHPSDESWARLIEPRDK